MSDNVLNQGPHSFEELIRNPAGLEEDDIKILYQELMQSSLREVSATPGTSTFMYMLIERSVYAFVVMKAMEKTGYSALDLQRYNQLFGLFTKTSSTVLTEMKKIFGDQQNLQYLFVSRVMEAFAASVMDTLPDSDSEKLLSSVREKLHALASAG